MNKVYDKYFIEEIKGLRSIFQKFNKISNKRNVN